MVDPQQFMARRGAWWIAFGGVQLHILLVFFGESHGIYHMENT
jgi:hypothetical protein